MWNKGCTESGSSGSPLLDNYGRVVGQLSFNIPPFNGYNYGRFDISWANKSSISEQLKHWLAGTSNPASLGGLGANIILSAPTIFVTPGTTTSITFAATSKLPTSIITSYEWEVMSGFTTSGTTTTTTPSISLTHAGMSEAVLGARAVLTGNRKTDWAYIIIYLPCPYGTPNCTGWCNLCNNLICPWPCICCPRPPCFLCSPEPCTCFFPAPILAFPNPVSDVLHIDLGQQTSTMCSCCGTKPAPEFIYDVRLIDGQGNIVRRQQQVRSGQVEFNVFNLPEGTYYLHIYDGVNKTPQMHQIVVKR